MKYYLETKDRHIVSYDKLQNIFWKETFYIKDKDLISFELSLAGYWHLTFNLLELRFLLQTVNIYNNNIIENNELYIRSYEK